MLFNFQKLQVTRYGR